MAALNLKAKRQLTEGGNEVVLVVVKNEDDCDDSMRTVLTITKDKDLYTLNRYYEMGASWMWSADVSDKTLAECLAELTDMFDEQYPGETLYGVREKLRSDLSTL